MTIRSVVIVTGLALALAACTSSSSSPAASSPSTPSSPTTPSSPSATPTPTPSETPTPSGAPTTPPVSPAKIVAEIALKKSDLNPGYTVKLEAGGDKVVGQVTLDNCGFAFTTESHRTARRQIDIFGPKHVQTGIENEVVAYDTEAEAKLALVEWRASMKHCRTGVEWTPRDPGTPPLRYLKFHNESVSALPAQDNAVSSIIATVKGSSQKVYVTAVFQRFGAVLDAVYYDSGAPQKTAELNAIGTLAAITGKRLVASDGTTGTSA